MLFRSLLTAKPGTSSNNTARNSYRYNNGKVHKSDALGVSPDQVEEYRSHLRAHGITAEVYPDGRVGITSAKQFQDIAKAGGLFNGRDGYGAKDGEGNRIMTGREQVRAREAVKEMLRKESRGYPSEFPRELLRRRP